MTAQVLAPVARGVRGTENHGEALLCRPGACYYSGPCTQCGWHDDSQITSEDGIFARVPTSGGQPEILARGQHGPGDVLVAGDDVYWLNLGYWENALDGSLMRMRKSCP